MYSRGVRFTWFDFYSLKKIFIFRGNELTCENALTSFQFLTVYIQTTLLMESKLNHGSLDIHREACWKKSN